MRRRKVLVALAGLAVVVAVGVVVMWPRRREPTGENFERIRQGMTRAEVEAIVGPPGNFTTGPLYWHRTLKVDEESWPTRADRNWCWIPDDGTGYVDFDSEGLVKCSGFEGTLRQEQSFSENLLWRAKRQWHRWFP
jgi:hypothetical protein